MGVRPDRLEGALDDVELPDALEATYSVTMQGEQSNKPCCVAEWVVRYYS